MAFAKGHPFVGLVILKEGQGKPAPKISWEGMAEASIFLYH